jgi:RNA polymerase sigma factor (sigma-70 family)
MSNTFASPARPKARGTPEDETTLLGLALAGDPAAGRRLVDRLMPVIQARIASALLRSGGPGRHRARDDIEDLRQDVLLSLFERDARLLRAWDPARGASLRTFVGMIAERQAISALRASRRTLRDLDPSRATREAAQSNAAAPDRAAASRQELRLMLEQLEASLPRAAADLVRRLLLHDEPAAEVARATGHSVNALYIWRSRALALARSIRRQPRSAGAG